MLFRKCLFRYLCTLPLFDLLILLRILTWDLLPGLRDDPVFPLLFLPGVLFLAGMLAGIFWGGLPGLHGWTAAAYSLASLPLCPLPYFFRGDPELFWPLLLLLGGQQSAGFLAGACGRISWVRSCYQALPPKTSVPDSADKKTPENGRTD